MIKLINLPQPNSLDDHLDPPLGLMYIAGVLKKAGVDVKIIDLCFIERESWRREIGYAQVYGFTVFSSSLYLAKEVTNLVKQINPSCRTVVGGPHPTSLPFDMIEFFDVVVRGEGEYAFFQPQFHNYSSLLQMSKVDDLNIIPSPAWDLVELSSYTRKVCGVQATSITTSRGCPYTCAFCCKDVHGTKVRYFSIDRVISEIEQLKYDYGIKAFIFYDDTFALDRARFYPLCKELKKLDIIFRCNGDVRNNTLDDFNILYEAGCREIAFGIESGSQKILDIINKGTTVGGNKNAIVNAKKAGLIVKAYLMVGSPSETRETIQDTIKFMRKANPDQYTLFNFIPLPGCDIWNNPDKYGIRIVNRDFKEFFNIAGRNEGGLVVESNTFNTDDLRRWRNELLEALPGQRGEVQDYYRRSNV